MIYEGPESKNKKDKEARGALPSIFRSTGAKVLHK